MTELVVFVVSELYEIRKNYPRRALKIPKYSTATQKFETRHPNWLCQRIHYDITISYHSISKWAI